MEALDVRRRLYTRERDARVALIRCGECEEYYETSVRQARRIRKGESRRLCGFCRTLEEAENCTPDQTQEYVRWWKEESGIPHAELLTVAMAVAASAFAQEKVPTPPEPDLSPSWRLHSEEGNTSNGAGPAIRISLGVISVHSTTSNAA